MSERASPFLHFNDTVHSHTVRLLPSTDDLFEPYEVVWLWSAELKRSTLSPVSFGRSDPVIEAAHESAARSGNESWYPYSIFGEGITVTYATYLPCVLRADETEAPIPYLLKMPRSLLRDAGWKQAVRPRAGYDIRLSRSGRGAQMKYQVTHLARQALTQAEQARLKSIAESFDVCGSMHKAFDRETYEQIRTSLIQPEKKT